MDFIFKNKTISHEKPTYLDIFHTLQNLKTFCVEQSIKVIGLPKICLGLDNKESSIISNMLKFVFQNKCQ